MMLLARNLSPKVFNNVLALTISKSCKTNTGSVACSSSRQIVPVNFCQSKAYHTKCLLYQNRRQTYTTVVDKIPQADSLHKLSPYDFLDILRKENISRCFILKNGEDLQYSHDLLRDIFDESQLKELGHDHEAIFFDRGQRAGCLMAVFLWKTNRGQGVSKSKFIRST